ncbi:MAG: hypothetical protein IT384_23140 [Deltaproteobacteria bacterium]|nr:hypothetical protein [Deltaproteobacteria bacterium]
MDRRASLLWAVLGATVAPGPAQAGDATTAKLATIEVSLGGGPSLAAAVGVRDRGGTARVAAAGALTVLVRSRYFLSPFLELGTVNLFSGVIRGVEGSPDADSSLSATSLLFGPAIDLGPLRLEAALGTFRLTMRSRIAGDLAVASEGLLGYSLGATAFVLAWPQVRLGVQLKAQAITEASILRAQLGLALSVDAASW